VLAHGKANRTAQGCRTATQARTAKTCTHGNAVPHGKEMHARQRQARTTKAFAVQNGHAHGNIGVASGRFAGKTLPCI
jgi:hypothetical protein